MTAQQTLKRITDIINGLPSESREVVDRMLKNPTDFREDSTDSNILLASMVIDLRKEIQAETAKSRGIKSQYNAANRILKNAKKLSKDTPFQYASTVKDMQYVCDTFHGVRLADPLPLPELPESQKAPNYEQIFSTPSNVEMIELPIISELKAYIKICKSEKRFSKKILYDFGKYYPIVDAEYLLNILEILPNAKAFVKSSNSELNLNIIYFIDGDNLGLLCSINITDLPRKKTELS